MIDKQIQQVAKALTNDNLIWHGYNDYIANYKYAKDYVWYYAESELYVIRSQRTQAFYFINARSPQEALAILLVEKLRTFVELPCKVGDKVYVLIKYAEELDFDRFVVKYKIEEHICEYVGVGKDGIYINSDFECWEECDVIDTFATKEQAEKELAELKGAK